MYGRGSAPQVGLVQDSAETFQQVPFFFGVEVEQLVAGDDFCLALVSHAGGEEGAGAGRRTR